MQFVIHAYDGKDEGALARRMAVRAEHLENIKKYNENGNVICAGGMTNENGVLMGSVLIMNFETKDQLDEYLKSEPYIRTGVWQDIKIDTCNVLITNDITK